MSVFRDSYRRGDIVRWSQLGLGFEQASAMRRGRIVSAGRIDVSVLWNDRISMDKIDAAFLMRAA